MSDEGRSGDDSGTRTLLVKTRSEGELKVTIPADWKVTFSDFNPGNRGSMTGPALRIYESDTKQRACFVDVVSFRDLSIPVQRLVKDKSGKREWQSLSDGTVRETHETKVDERWQDES